MEVQNNATLVEGQGLTAVTLYCSSINMRIHGEGREGEGRVREVEGEGEGRVRGKVGEVRVRGQ